MSADVGAVAGGHGVTDAMVEAAAVELWDYDERHHASWAETAEGFQFAFRVEVRRALAAALATQPNVPTPQQVEAAARAILDVTYFGVEWEAVGSFQRDLCMTAADSALRAVQALATGGRGGAVTEGHADTARLDWLERQCYEAVYSADDNDNDVRIGDVMLSGGFAHTFSCEVGDRTVSGIYGESSDTLRAAIDAAMTGGA